MRRLCLTLFAEPERRFSAAKYASAFSVCPRPGFYGCGFSNLQLHERRQFTGRTGWIVPSLIGSEIVKSPVRRIKIKHAVDAKLRSFIEPHDRVVCKRRQIGDALPAAVRASLALVLFQCRHSWSQNQNLKMQRKRREQRVLGL